MTHSETHHQERPRVERPVRTRGRNPLIAVAALLGFTSSAVTFMLTPLLPVLQREFHLTVGDVAWVLTLLLIGGGVSTILLPRLADVLGDRGAATLGAALLAAGMLVPGISHTFPAMLIGAAVMGLGSAAGQLGVGVLRRHLAGSSVHTAVIVSQVAQAVGAGVGLVAGGLALSRVSMQDFFLGATVVYVVVGICVWAVIPSSSRDAAAAFGIGNVIGLVAWIVLLLYGIKTAGSDGISSAKAIGFAAAGLGGGAVWVTLEKRSKTPVFHLALLRSGTVARTVVAGFTIGMAIQSVTFLIPFYVQTPSAAGYGLGYDALDTGLLLLPYSLLGALAGIGAGVLGARTRPLLVAGVGATCHCAAALTLILAMSGGASVASFLVAACVYGVGSGLVGVGLFSSIQSSVRAELTGMGIGMIGIIMTISGALGPAIYSSILQSKSVAAIPGVPAEDRFRICLLVAGCCDVLVAFICYSARRGRVPASAQPSVGAPADQLTS
ncbi:MFS transporter [Streptomyces sp. NPDC008139]|uniref:MFS transporter n=1 Tax=Streptomyces sp. NPDC008139 TaxID=3364814 RepID=UPI0036ED5011